MASLSVGPPVVPQNVVGRRPRGEKALAVAPALAPTWRVRDLPAAEWAKLQQIPMVAQGLITPDPENFRAIVAELGEGPEAQIIGCWFAFNSPHLEPVWIHPDHRKRPGMIRQLWSKTIGLLQEMGVSMAFCTVADETALSSMPMVLRLGFQRVRAETYLLNLNNPETAARVKQITRGEG